ncbi:MAG: DUF2505 domain-containing protein [Burkholderiales bacterium]|nr:DUF2505 domain-containing protein [Burkholderiales bacterium]
MAVVALEVVQDFPAGLDRMWKVFGKPEYTERKYRALGSTEVRIRRCEASAREIRVELERASPVAVAELPAWARPFVGDRQRMRHATRWRRVAPDRVEATLAIDPVGQPVTARGHGTAVELDPKHTRLTLRFDVACRIPRLGERIAALYASQVEAALAADHRFTLEYLREAG